MPLVELRRERIYKSQSEEGTKNISCCTTVGSYITSYLQQKFVVANATLNDFLFAF